MFIEGILLARGGVELTEADMSNDLFVLLVNFMLLIMALKLLEFMQHNEEVDEQ